MSHLIKFFMRILYSEKKNKFTKNENVEWIFHTVVNQDFRKQKHQQHKTLQYVWTINLLTHTHGGYRSDIYVMMVTAVRIDKLFIISWLVWYFVYIYFTTKTETAFWIRHVGIYNRRNNRIVFYVSCISNF